MSYKQTVELGHHESLMKVDKRTGEATEVKFNTGGNPDKTYLNKGVSYKKNFPRAWKLLSTQTSGEEYKLAHELAMRALAFNNALIPFSDDMSYSKMANLLEVSDKTIKKRIDKLFKLGVLGKWEVYTAKEEYKKYWVFNPYLSFNGQYIDKTLLDMFNGTYYALA